LRTQRPDRFFQHQKPIIIGELLNWSNEYDKGKG
jgi:hypothetical protein